MIKVFDKKLLFSICGIILIFLLIFTIYMENQVTYTNGDALSNKKIGWGIKREKDHKRPDVGKENAELMEKYDVDTAEYVDNTITLAVDKQIVGYITLKEELRENVENILDNLKEAGVKDVAILTGDNKKAAKNIADKLKISQVYAELLPQEKLNKVKELQADKNKVTFLGDGINDSISLVTADIGVSMGGVGSAAAIEASDVVIMTDELSKILEAIKISKKTEHIIKQNLIFAIGTKILVLVLSIIGVSNMWQAIFADVGVTLITILNTLRILKKR